MIHDVRDTGPYFDPSFHSPLASRSISVRLFRFSHRLRSVLNSLHNTCFPYPLLSTTSIDANAASNSDIILLLALQILSL